MQSRIVFFCGAILGAFGVALAAMGDHLVRGGIDNVMYHGYETAVRYQMFHALALMLLGVWSQRQPSQVIAASACLFVLGVAGFCGGLYARILFPAANLVWVVPVGGTLLILGWLTAALAALAGEKNRPAPSASNPDEAPLQP